MDYFDIKNEIYESSLCLEDGISNLRKNNISIELINLIERAKYLANVLILNFKKAAHEDIKKMSEVLHLCNITINHYSEVSINEIKIKLYDFIVKLEETFKNKKFLLETCYN